MWPVAPLRGALGVKVTVLPLQLKLPPTEAPLLVRLSEKADSTEARFIARSKVAETVVVRATPVAPPAGLTEETTGGAGGVAPPTLTIFATDGTPLPSITNSMYGPGGAMLALAGAVGVTVPPPVVNESGT